MLINNMFTGSLEPSATVAGCVEIFENAWPDPEIAVTRLEMECGNTDSGMGWNRAHTVGQGVRQKARTNLSLNITQAGEGSNNQVAKDIHNQFFYLRRKLCLLGRIKHQMLDQAMCFYQNHLNRQ